MASDWISFPCIQIEQPIGKFYIGAIDSGDLARISFADRREIEQGKRDIEIISGIQRELSKKRVAELRKYVNNVDATFPTGIILAMSSEDAEFDTRTHMMKVRNAGHVAKIIDGQHRIEGLGGYEGESPFELNVTIFIDMDMDEPSSRLCDDKSEANTGKQVSCLRPVRLCRNA